MLLGISTLITADNALLITHTEKYHPIYKEREAKMPNSDSDCLHASTTHFWLLVFFWHNLAFQVRATKPWPWPANKAIVIFSKS